MHFFIKSSTGEHIRVLTNQLPALEKALVAHALSLGFTEVPFWRWLIFKWLKV